MIVEYAGRLMGNVDFEERYKNNDFLMEVGPETAIDAQEIGNVARFVNFSRQMPSSIMWVIYTDLCDNWVLMVLP